jgi:polysaccharide biosynthesis PFTS motif protein
VNNSFDHIHVINETVSKKISLLISSLKSRKGLRKLEVPEEFIYRTVVQALILGNTGKFYGHSFTDEAISIKKDGDTIEIVNAQVGGVHTSLKTIIKSAAKFYVRQLIGFKKVCTFLLSPRSDDYNRFNIIEFLNLENSLGKNYKSLFSNFCEGNQIPPLNSDSILNIIEDRSFDSQVNNCVFTKSPYFSIIPSLSSKVKFLRDYVCYSLVINFQFIKSVSLLSIIEKDLAELPLIYSLDNQSLIENIFTSNSSMYKQPLWFHRNQKNFSTNMIWYSTNNKPLVYKDHRFSQTMFYFDFLKVENHFVWNETEKSWVEKYIDHKSIHNSSPIMFRPLPEKRAAENKSREIVITLFDMTPYGQDIWDKAYSKNSYNYYEFGAVEKFYKDIIEVSTEIEKEKSISISINTKNKRGFSSAHDPRYKDLLQEIKPSVDIKDHTTDIFNLIQESNAILVFPYSSPAPIADYFQKPVAFYDSLGVLEPTASSIETICNRDRLKSFVESLIN